MQAISDTTLSVFRFPPQWCEVLRTLFEMTTIDLYVEKF